MQPVQSSTPLTSSPSSSCRYCRAYEPEGRRGGWCQHLNVPVQGQWPACPLSMPPFSPTWEHMQELLMWPEEYAAPRPPVQEAWARTEASHGAPTRK